MNCNVKRRGVRYAEEISGLEALPDFKDVQLVTRFIVHDEIFVNLQYVLYFKNETYSIDLPNIEDFEEFNRYLDEKFKAAGVNPKFAKGTLQHYWGD